MSKRSQDKRRARAKEKKLAKRRLQGTSPLARLADERHCECWLGTEPEERALSLHISRPVRTGQSVGAFFLIDRDCLGLKDAFYRLDIDPVALRELLHKQNAMQDMRTAQITLEEARKLVAQAIRWTRQHPFFRLPPDTERCLKIIGGVSDIETADISAFGHEGGLLYIGRKVDLERRLFGITLQEFQDREDVECEFIFSEKEFLDESEEQEEEFDEEGNFLPEALGEGDADEEGGDEELSAYDLQEQLKEMQDKLKYRIMDAARRWCISKAIMPHPDLEAAIDLALSASLEGLGEEDELKAVEKAMDAEKVLKSFEDPAKIESLAAARAQYQQFVDSYPSPEAFFAAMGLNDPDSF